MMSMGKDPIGMASPDVVAEQLLKVGAEAIAQLEAEPKKHYMISNEQISGLVTILEHGLSYNYAKIIFEVLKGLPEIEDWLEKDVESAPTSDPLPQEEQEN